MSNLPSSVINKFDRKISGKGAARARKRFILFISNEDINDIIKTIKPLKDSTVLIGGVTETVKDVIKKQEGGFLGALLAPLAASLVQPVIYSVVKVISRKRIYEWKFLVPLHPLNNIKIINYFKYEPRFNGEFSRNNLPKIKNGAYVINLNDENIKGTHWVLLLIDKNTAVYFDFFGIGYIQQEVLNKFKDKSITHNIVKIQHFESIICRFHRTYDFRKNFVRLY